jgi:hypothetical protein
MFAWGKKKKKHAPRRKAAGAPARPEGEWDFLRTQPDFDADEMSSVHAAAEEPTPATVSSEPVVSVPVMPEPPIAARPSRPLRTSGGGEHGTRPLTNLSALGASFQTRSEVVALPERREDHAPGWTLTLHIENGHRGFERTIAGDTTLGRSDPENGWMPDIDLSPDDATSRRHAIIYVRRGRYWLKDLDSLNGTRHNGQWLQPGGEVLLLEGDEIVLGEKCRIQIVDPEIGSEEPAITDLLLDFAAAEHWREAVDPEGVAESEDALPAPAGDLLDVALLRGCAVGLIEEIND